MRDLLTSSTRFTLLEEQDYIEYPQPSGYRALHIVLMYEVTGAIVTQVLLEIQIRTLAQDTWARLAHYDLYKHDDDVPSHIITSSKRPSLLLSLADQHAQDIREQVSQPLVGIPGTSATLEPASLAFIFKRAFGSDPSEHLVKSVLRRCQEIDCFRLDLVDRVVGDVEARNRLEEAYREEAGWDISEEELFLLFPDLAAFGLESATATAADYGRNAKLEADSIARQGILSELPETLGEFEDWPVVNYSLAEELEALTECSVCGAPIVDTWSFVENLLEYYGVDEDHVDEDQRMRIHSIVNESGIEVGDMVRSRLCSYHGYVMGRED